jgi:hypothetical protein
MTKRAMVGGMALVAACHAAGGVRDTSPPHPDPNGVQHHFLWDFAAASDRPPRRPVISVSTSTLVP